MLYTIGHGRRTTAEFIGALHAYGVERLVDVRRHPASRTNPQFAKDRLLEDLSAAGVGYEHWPTLGGRRQPLSADSLNGAWKNAGFRAYADYMLQDAFWNALDELLAGATDVRTAVMCAETLWWRCHRRLIADAATGRGVKVMHILKADAVQPHPLLPPARVVGNRVSYSPT